MSGSRMDTVESLNFVVANFCGLLKSYWFMRISCILLYLQKEIWHYNTHLLNLGGCSFMDERYPRITRKWSHHEIYWFHMYSISFIHYFALLDHIKHRMTYAIISFYDPRSPFWFIIWCFMVSMLCMIWSPYWYI